MASLAAQTTVVVSIRCNTHQLVIPTMGGLHCWAARHWVGGQGSLGGNTPVWWANRVLSSYKCEKINTTT